MFCKYSRKGPLWNLVLLGLAQAVFNQRALFFFFLQLQNKILQSTLWKLLPQMFLQVPPSLRLLWG